MTKITLGMVVHRKIGIILGIYKSIETHQPLYCNLITTEKKTKKTKKTKKPKKTRKTKKQKRHKKQKNRKNKDNKKNKKIEKRKKKKEEEEKKKKKKEEKKDKNKNKIFLEIWIMRGKAGYLSKQRFNWATKIYLNNVSKKKNVLPIANYW